jgi:hypothetical protein
MPPSISTKLCSICNKLQDDTKPSPKLFIAPSQLTIQNADDQVHDNDDDADFLSNNDVDFDDDCGYEGDRRDSIDTNLGSTIVSNQQDTLGVSISGSGMQSSFPSIIFNTGLEFCGTDRADATESPDSIVPPSSRNVMCPLTMPFSPATVNTTIANTINGTGNMVAQGTSTTAVSTIHPPLVQLDPVLIGADANAETLHFMTTDLVNSVYYEKWLKGEDVKIKESMFRKLKQNRRTYYYYIGEGKIHQFDGGKKAEIYAKAIAKKLNVAGAHFRQGQAK